MSRPLPKPILRRTETYCSSIPTRIKDGVHYTMLLSYTNIFCYKQYGTDGSDGSSRECTKHDLEEWYDSLTETSPYRDAIQWEISKMCFGKYTRNILRNKKRENR